MIVYSSLLGGEKGRQTDRLSSTLLHVGSDLYVVCASKQLILHRQNSRYIYRHEQKPGMGSRL